MSNYGRCHEEDNFVFACGWDWTVTWWLSSWGKNKNICDRVWVYGGKGRIRNYPRINLMSQKDYVSPLRMGRRKESAISCETARQSLQQWHSVWLQLNIELTPCIFSSSCCYVLWTKCFFFINFFDDFCYSLCCAESMSCQSKEKAW
jgi:hypothetical protein